MLAAVVSAVGLKTGAGHRAEGLSAGRYGIDLEFPTSSPPALRESVLPRVAVQPGTGGVLLEVPMR